VTEQPQRRCLTVAICTWNRSQVLRQTLDRLTKLTIPPGVVWEVLVVDNNSTDATARVLKDFLSRLPIRALRERRQGKAHALNLATAEAAGEFILWTDDDVLVHQGWLAAYDAAFRRWPDAGLFGGPIEPVFVGTPPWWLSRVFPHSWAASAYGTLMFGEEALPLSEELRPYGANMAVRRELQRQFRYDPSRGPRGSHYVVGEETTMVLAMLRAGHSGWYVPDARVQHIVPPSHQTTAHLRRYARGFGESLSVLDDHHREQPMLFGKPLFMIREALEAEARYRWRRLTTPPEVWIRDLGRAGMNWGKLHRFGRDRRQ
jgi:glycosyltransferase involved in cell wall biosynthesis